MLSNTNNITKSFRGFGWKLLDSGVRLEVDRFIPVNGKDGRYIRLLTCGSF
jgi:hypothetical protein